MYRKLALKLVKDENGRHRLYQKINKHTESSGDLHYPCNSLEASAKKICDFRGFCLKNS